MDRRSMETTITDHTTRLLFLEEEPVQTLVDTNNMWNLHPLLRLIDDILS